MTKAVKDDVRQAARQHEEDLTLAAIQIVKYSLGWSNTNDRYNEFGGKDLWTNEQTGMKTAYNKFSGNYETYFAEGVRIVKEDAQILVMKFVGNGILETKITLEGRAISADLLAAMIKELLCQN